MNNIRNQVTEIVNNNPDYAYDMENELYIFGINIDLDETYVYETLIGDVSDDGVINIKDITAIHYHIAKFTTLKGGRLTAADTNRDGSLSIADIALIYGIILG